MREAMPGTRAITLFDANGTLTARSPDQFVGQNFKSRDYFQIALAGGNPAMLYVSPPFLAATGEYVINLVKVLPDQNGAFGGIILASLDPGYFKTLLESVQYAPDMWTGLAHGDGKVFQMVPSRPGVEGTDLAIPDSFFSRHRASGQRASVMTGTIFLTGEEGMVAVRTIGPAHVAMDKPLVLIVARDLASIFAPVREDLKEQGGLFALLVVVASLGLYFYQQRQRVVNLLLASQEAERQQADADLRIAAAAFESQEGMIVTDANSVILRVNQAFTANSGYTAQEVIGQNPRLFKSSRHEPHFYQEMWATLLGTGKWQGEIWDRRKDGLEYPKWLTISAVKDAAGAVTHYIGAQYDITERLKAEEKIRELAYFDQLTGLPNRTLLHDRLKQVMTASHRSGDFGAALFIDLDHFKTLNDTQGQEKGNQLLLQIALRLRANVRDGDTVAHLGGDEFVMVLANLSSSQKEAATQTKTVGKKILTLLNHVHRLGDADHHNTASIGATLFCGLETSIDDVLKQANLAMCKSKETGRNRLHFFDPAMQAIVMERSALEADLRKAIVQNQFIFHYQPQVDGRGGITGAEVLVRWQHPERGMVSPLAFIGLAEETGLILPLGNWVLETACTQLKRWVDQPELAHLSLAVNVSARQFGEADFVKQVMAVLAQTGANPQRLKLELTESLLVANVEQIIGKMLALKEHGVGFSLDDFGTGYSSLSYLKRLPLDQLKIDQSFVREALTDQNNAAIVRTIVALAQSLGLGVIAEGVETLAQRDFLANAGCQACQGYFFGRPMPVADFEKFAKDGVKSLGPMAITDSAPAGAPGFFHPCGCALPGH